MLQSIIKSLPVKFWFILAIFIGTSIVTTPIALTYLLVHSGGINYKTEDTEINVVGKKIANETEYSNKKLKEKLLTLEQKIENLKSSGKQNPDYFIEQVDKSFEDLKPTATEAIENSNELTEIISDK